MINFGGHNKGKWLEVKILLLMAIIAALSLIVMKIYEALGCLFE